MVRTTSFVFAVALSCGYVLAAPVNVTVGADLLLQNGQDAQNLNSQFLSLNITDPCQFGAEACIAGAQAQCNSEGSWEVQPCPSQTQCFVVPNTKSEGVHLKCTTEQDAQIAIQNTGAEGGLSVNNSTDSGNNTISSIPIDGSVDNSGSTATVTILVDSSTTQTLDPQTTTLDQGGAPSLISFFSTTSSSDPAFTSTSSDPAVTGVQGAVAVGTPSIILLTPVSSASSSSTPTPDAAVVSPSSPSTPTPPPSDGGYKY